MRAQIRNLGGPPPLIPDVLGRGKQHVVFGARQLVAVALAATVIGVQGGGGAAHAAGPQSVLLDCNTHLQLTHPYSIGQLQSALKSISMAKLASTRTAPT
ncbi:hypothetical protein AYO39_01095 [Actinobacteria bacterium SCGC AG-212-D09]|nr:hypothetical protein AYO39_01095 [Actinobacteria bacterium SCGC AG-212-D09]